MLSSYIRLWFIYVVNMFGYGVICNRTYHRKTVLGIHLSEEKHVCSRIKNLFEPLSPNMVNMQLIHRWWSRVATSMQLSTSNHTLRERFQIILYNYI
ncbi:MAG TPA: hypothetical protein VJL78_06995, partial [Candidatus Nitrosocosmicus sp.]|nr:hypothetical protein [Candidatus Nitrosocosmicus sp.]